MDFQTGSVLHGYNSCGGFCFISFLTRSQKFSYSILARNKKSDELLFFPPKKYNQYLPNIVFEISTNQAYRQLISLKSFLNSLCVCLWEIQQKTGLHFHLHCLCSPKLLKLHLYSKLTAEKTRWHSGRRS